MTYRPRRVPGRIISDAEHPQARATRRIVEALEAEFGDDWQIAVQTLFGAIHNIAHANGCPADEMVSLHRQCIEQVPPTWYAYAALTDRRESDG